MKSRLIVLFLTAALLLSTHSGFCLAADNQDLVLKMAFQNSLDHTQGQGALKFAELVKKKSDGRLIVELYPGGQLGGDMKTVSDLQRGKVDLTVANAGLLSGLVKGFGIFDFPFLFSSTEEADAIVDGPFGQKLLDNLPPIGLVGLGYWELGFRNFTNNIRPINRLEDFSGIRLRVLRSPIFVDTFKALGCDAIPLPWPQVYSALENKQVDGQENPVTNVQFANLYEVQKYFSFTRHVYSPQAVLISKMTWKKLSRSDREIITEAEKEARSYQRRINRSQMSKSLAFIKNHMQVNVIPDSELRRIRKAILPVIDKYTAQVGADVVKAFNQEIAKVR